MQLALTTLILAASSALALTIQTPDGWTTTGPNTISFSAVSSDPLSFAITLSPQTNSNDATVIVESHSASETTFNVSAECSKLFPEGDNYVLNFVRNSTSLTTLLAQSQNFTISASSSSACSSSGSSSAGASASSTARASASDAAASASSAVASASASAVPGSAAFSTAVIPSLGLLGAGALALLTFA